MKQAYDAHTKPNDVQKTNGVQGMIRDSIVYRCCNKNCNKEYDTPQKWCSICETNGVQRWLLTELFTNGGQKYDEMWARIYNTAEYDTLVEHISNANRKLESKA